MCFVPLTRGQLESVLRGKALIRPLPPATLDSPRALLLGWLGGALTVGACVVLAMQAATHDPA